MTLSRQIPIIALSLAIAAFWFLSNFMASEDASILFNRSNHLDLGTFFYHAGYLSGHPQLVASLVSPLPPLAQALIYAGVAYGLWCLLFIYMARISGNLYVTLCMIAYFSIFDQIYITNLTYSLWTSLALIGLIGLCASMENRALHFWEGILVAVLAMASPLSLFLVPLFAYRSLRYRHDRWSQIGLLMLVAAFILLPDPDSQRANASQLITRLITGIGLMISDPSHYMVDAEHSAILKLRSVSQWLLLLVFVIGTPLLILRNHVADRLGFGFFALSFLTVFLVSLAASALPLQSRYWFPVAIAGGVVLGLMTRSLNLRVLQITLGLCLLAALGAHTQRALRWGDIRPDLQKLVNGHSENTAILRARYGNGARWAIGLGQYGFTADGCRDTPYHSKAETHDFRIFCGRAPVWPQF